MDALAPSDTKVRGLHSFDAVGVAAVAGAAVVVGVVVVVIICYC